MSTLRKKICANLKSGGTSGKVYGSENLNSILKAVQNLPEDERVDYDSAMEKAPHLVLKETDPLRFLRMASGNVQVAALHLAHHWTQRRGVFGDRYTLSLNLTGQGAMEPADIETLKTGFFCILPSGSEVMTVSYFDVSKVVQIGLEKAFRCLFYVAFQAWQKEKPVFLIRYSESPVINRQKMLKLLGVYESLSLTITQVLCVYKPPPGAKHLFLQAIAPIVEGFIRENKSNMRSIICDTPQDILKELLMEGFSPDSLPSSVGGMLRPEDIAALYSSQELEDLALSQKPLCKDSPMESIARVRDGEMRAIVFHAVETLSDDDRSAFDEAQARVPEIVRIEMDPAFLLRFEGGDATAAARRLLAYWRKRKSVYGERFLLPLNLSGKGALSPSDIEALESGCISFLPNDCHGRQVLFIDFAKGKQLLVGLEGLLRRFRCIFYMLSHAVKNEKPLLVMRIFDNEGSDQSEIIEIVPVMPVAIDTVAILCQPPIGTALVFKQKTLPIMQEAMSRAAAHVKSYVHSTPADFLKELVELGCSENGLPETVGGTWTYEHFYEWLESQFSRLPRDDSDDRALDAMSALSSLARAANMKVQEERKDRKRKLDVMYARNRRQRERDEEEVLQKQCFDLSIANMALEEEEKRLRKLLSEAVVKVKDFETNLSSIETMRAIEAERLGSGVSSSLELLAKSRVIDSLSNPHRPSETKDLTRAKAVDTSRSDESAVVSALRQYQHRPRTAFAADTAVGASLSSRGHLPPLHNARQSSVMSGVESVVPSTLGVFPGLAPTQLALQPDSMGLYATSNVSHSSHGQNTLPHSAQLLSRGQDLLSMLPGAKNSFPLSERAQAQLALQQVLNTRLVYPPRVFPASEFSLAGSTSESMRVPQVAIPDTGASRANGANGITRNDVLAELLLTELLASKVPGYGNGLLRR